MAKNPTPKIIPTLVLATMIILAHTRPLTNTTTIGAPSLAARLKLEKGDDVEDGGSTGCWDTLFQLHACTGEIILFFLNGETYLGMGCCKAIIEIEKQCWPSLMGSLGFTSEEGDILRGYCKVSNSSDVPTTPSPPRTTPLPPPTTNTTTSNSTDYAKI